MDISLAFNRSALYTGLMFEGLWNSNKINNREHAAP